MSNWLDQVKKIIACGKEMEEIHSKAAILAMRAELLLSISADALTTWAKLIYNNILCGTMPLPSQLMAFEAELVKAETEYQAAMASLSSYGAGTAYSITNASAAVDLGTTDPVLTFLTPGKYLIQANLTVLFNGATFAASQDVTAKLRKTSGTPADLSNSTRVVKTGVTTTLTGTLGVIALPPVIYQAAAGDVVKPFILVATAPSAGSLQVTSAEMVATRIS